MLRVVVAAPPAVVAPSDLARLPACADVVELRLDLLPSRDAGADVDAWLASWIEASPRPVLATVRSRAEGGAFEGSAEEAATLLAAAAAAGAAYVDVELAVAPHLETLAEGTHVVASYHGVGEARPPETVGGRGVHRWKVARPVASAAALAACRDEARTAAGDGRTTVVPYGALGGFRAACVHPGALLYGSAGASTPVVQGQPSLVELIDDLRAGEVGPDARLYGLLGRPPSRSPSPALHNAAFRALQEDALYVPLPDLGLEDALGMPFAGLSVTTPWKREALALATSADDATRQIGAANTLVPAVGGGWRASNTDAEAVARAVPAPRRGETAWVYGTGGYARAACFALERRGYALRVAGRNEERGKRLAAAGGWSWAGPDFVRQPTDRVLVNATPVGADGAPPTFVDPDDIEGLVVLDAPYRSEPGTTTGLTSAAAGRAADVVDGRRLLVLQAHGQVRAFTGTEVDDAVLDLAIRPPPPLALLGLRGAGKSTVGRRLALRLGRPFLDLDEEVERRTGRPPGAWIRAGEERAFRAVEAGLAAGLAGRRGVVVATGGGIVERSEGRAALEAHTFPVFLDVPAEVAATRVARDTERRPLLVGAVDRGDEARRLDAVRRPLYESVARHVVDASVDVDEVTDAVSRCWLRIRD